MSLIVAPHLAVMTVIPRLPSLTLHLPILKITLNWSFFYLHAKKVRHFAKRYCNSIDFKLVFSSFNIGNVFGVKNPIPRVLRAGVVYKCSCAGCSTCYVGGSTRNFSTRVRQHLFSDTTSQITTFSAIPHFML